MKEKSDAYFNDLCECNIKTLFLHSPPSGIINKEYLELINNYLKQKNIKLGISWPHYSDFEFLLNKFPNLIFQVSLKFFLDNQKQIIENFKFVYINSIIKNSTNVIKNKKTKISLNEYLQDVEMREGYKIVIGINSEKSVEMINQII